MPSESESEDERREASCLPGSLVSLEVQLSSSHHEYPPWVPYPTTDWFPGWLGCSFCAVLLSEFCLLFYCLARNVINHLLLSAVWSGFYVSLVLLSSPGRVVG